jgi:glycosyltransferase involved in cell wall biosynthesis
MKVAILASELAGYTSACFKVLSGLVERQLFLCRRRAVAAAPFDDRQFGWCNDELTFDGAAPDAGLLLDRLERYQPDVLLVCSWHLPAYRAACRRFACRSVRVLFMDNPWLGTARQWLGVAIAPWYIQRSFDAVLLPGERQEQFARRLGFRGRTIIRGGLSCDRESFAAAYAARSGAGTPPQSFLFVGRHAFEKGVDTLATAYKAYRARSDPSWTLDVYGVGPLTRVFQGLPGVTMHGFVQPAGLPDAFARAGCLVLPSRFDPWGVVIHEATSAGLPVLASSACGACVELIQDGHNGLLFEPGDAAELQTVLTRFSALPDAARRAMGDASFEISKRFTPRQWAVHLHGRLEELCRARRS